MIFPCRDCKNLDICLKRIRVDLLNISGEGRVLSINNTPLFFLCTKYRNFIVENEENFENAINFFINLLNPNNKNFITRVQYKTYDFWKKELLRYEEKIKSTTIHSPIINRSISKKGSLESYIGYDNYCSKVRKKSIEEMFNTGMYTERNLIIVDFLKNISEDLNIFEFAATYGFLAIEISKQIKFDKYVISNFLQEVVEYMKNQKLQLYGIEIILFDANDIIKSPLENFNVFICTSLEHLEKDREIIGSLPKKSHFLFSVPNFDDPTHFRIFKSKDDIYSRYSNYLDIIQIKEIRLQHMKKFICNSRIL